MFEAHYPALVAASLVGLGGWLVARRLRRDTWPSGPGATFVHPWREFGLALLGGAGDIGVGGLWSQGIRLPEISGVG